MYVGAEVLSLASVYFLNLMVVLQTQTNSELVEMVLHRHPLEKTLRLRVRTDTDRPADCSYKSKMAAEGRPD